MRKAVSRLLILHCSLFSVLAVGCQQKMAEQPSPRPYEQHAGFEHKQSARPLERGVVHRNQAVGDDPLSSWLTPEARRAQSGIKWSGDASFDPKSVVPPLGAPNDVKNFVSEFPFEITKEDLKRGHTLFNSNCALCHGAAGYGNGKIVERGFLKPPSFHTDPAGKATDTAHLNEKSEKALPVGYSRGFDRWGKQVAIHDVPVGYIYQVITWGYAGMPAHDVQLANPADRWRVIAYIRALQYSQQAAAADLPAAAKASLAQVGGSK